MVDRTPFGSRAKVDSCAERRAIARGTKNACDSKVAGGCRIPRKNEAGCATTRRTRPHGDRMKRSPVRRWNADCALACCRVGYGQITALSALLRLSPNASPGSRDQAWIQIGRAHV